MYDGCAEQHDGDVYHMWNPLTRTIYVTRTTRNVIWLKQMLFKMKVDEKAAELGAELGVETNSEEGNNDNGEEIKYNEETEKEIEKTEKEIEKTNDEHLDISTI